MNIQQRVGHMVMRVYALLNGQLKDKIKLTRINGNTGTFTFTYQDTAYTVTITAEVREVNDTDINTGGDSARPV